jgi:hypothetical protein
MRALRKILFKFISKFQSRKYGRFTAPPKFYTFLNKPDSHGCLLFSYREKALINWFIPGKWKHVATWNYLNKTVCESSDDDGIRVLSLDSFLLKYTYVVIRVCPDMDMRDRINFVSNFKKHFFSNLICSELIFKMDSDKIIKCRPTRILFWKIITPQNIYDAKNVIKHER